MSRLIIICLVLSPLLPLAQPFTLFPGDANNDGVANHYDILPIGVAYGAEGFPRPGASQQWIPQLHPQQWPLNLPVSGINFGFCDSDGNGFIDSLDVDAIALNFDSMQMASQPPPQPYLLPDTCFTCPKPDLLIQFDRDTAMVKDTFYAIITLRYPMEVDPQFGALGIAFDLAYDPEHVKDSLTKVFPDTMPGDLMFVTATQSLARPWRTVDPGNIKFGAAGKGMNPLFFTRPLGAVELVVDDMIIRSTAVQFWMDASDLMIINFNEQIVCPGVVEVDTLVLFDPLDAVGAAAQNRPDISVYPNPASDYLTVTSNGPLLENIILYYADGRKTPNQWEGSSLQVVLPTGGLPRGIYFLLIETAAGTMLERVLLMEADQ